MNPIISIPSNSSVRPDGFIASHPYKAALTERSVRACCSLLDVIDVTPFLPSQKPIARALYVRNYFHHVVSRIGKRFLWNEQWQIRIQSDRSYYDIVPPRDRIWADPFLVERDGLQYLFFEEQLVGSRGILMVTTIPDPAQFSSRTYRPSASSLTPILKKGYHLSYPHIFESGAEWYMIPETHQDNGVDLYRCTHFPDTWVWEERLIEGVQLVDCSPVFSQQPLVHYR